MKNDYVFSSTIVVFLHKVLALKDEVVFGCNKTYLIISYFLEISNYPPNLAPPRRGLKHNFKEAYVAQISGLTKGFYQDVMKNFVIIKIIFSMYFMNKTTQFIFIKNFYNSSQNFGIPDPIRIISANVR